MGEFKHNSDHFAQVDLDIILLKLVTIVGGGVSMVLGFQKLGYTGAGVLSCLIGAVTLAFLWQKRNVVTNDLVKIKVDGPPGDTSGTQGVPSTLVKIFLRLHITRRVRELRFNSVGNNQMGADFFMEIL